ncbi:SDR family NAD(P)-dependent oxidoreductase [Micromonosporaceae bacterium B7E4]
MPAEHNARRVLVTGGASGFGRHIAATLAAAGDHVAVADINGAQIEATRDALGLHGFVADVRSRDQVQALVGDVAAALGGIDALVVSAGVFQMGPLEGITEDEWDRVLDVNLKGAFLVSQACSAHLRASGRGRIVLIGSDCGRRGFAGQAAYVASKFGLNGLAESMAAELAPDHVTVNTLCPVGCPTTGIGQEVLEYKVAANHHTAEEIMAAAALTNPVGRNATEADVTNAVLFFLADSADFLTGVCLDVDGGAHLGSVPGLNP